MSHDCYQSHTRTSGNGGREGVVLDPLPGLGPRPGLQQEAGRLPAVVVEGPVEGVPEKVQSCSCRVAAMVANGYGFDQHTKCERVQKHTAVMIQS